jgi:replicative DNA helicase
MATPKRKSKPRGVPADRQMERSVVASMMVDAEAAAKVVAILRPEDFFYEELRQIYEVCRDLWQRGEAINQVTVAHELTRRGLLEKVGGMAYLLRLVADLPTPLVAEHYANVVARDAAYRRLLGVAQEVAEWAYRAEEPDVTQVVAKASARLASVLEPLVLAQEVMMAGETVGTEVKADVVVQTPIDFLPIIPHIPGIARGEMMVVGGDTSVGKSSFALAWAVRSAEAGQRVAYVSCEMPPEDVGRRLLSFLSGIPYYVLRTGEGELSFDDLQALERGREELKALPLLVTAGVHLTCDRLKAILLREKVTRGLDLVVVDYLQLLRYSRERERADVEEVTLVSRFLKQLALDLDVALISLSQLRRRRDQSEAPSLWDLRQSGAIEQDADYVLLLHWDRQQARVDAEGLRLLELQVAKNRHGPITTKPLELAFEAPTGRWRAPKDYLPQVSKARGRR